MTPIVRLTPATAVKGRSTRSSPRRRKKPSTLPARKADLRDRYGRNTFGQSCLLARRLVEHGVRLVTVNMFDTVFDKITWDCHADGGSLASDLDDYKNTLCPMFDRAYTSLLTDLKDRGMLDNTLVLAMGEFGRTPHLNPRGGARPLARRLVGAFRRRRRQGRTGGWLVGSHRRRAEGSSDHASRGGCDGVSRPGS